MRTFRVLLPVALIAAAASAANAQQGRPFTDAWFWGAKTGVFGYGDASGNLAVAPLAGVEWLITRTHGGLYVSGGQYLISTTTTVQRDPSSADTTATVDLSGMRRIDFVMMGFPGEHVTLHPYFGAGVTIQSVSGTPVSGQPFTSRDQIDYTNQNIRALKTALSPIAMLGAQYRMRLVSLFAQASIVPGNANFLLYNGRSMFWGLEFGVRYNAGSSIEKGP